MSLFGTGRREGITACALLALLIAALHVGSAALGDTAPAVPPHPGTAAVAALLAIGGVGCYRLLRALDLSRYAAFLGGTAYGAAPLLGSLAQTPHELWAAAAAPFALEAAQRWDRSASRARFAPWTGCLLALPFAAGVTVIGGATAVLALTMLVTNVLTTRREERPATRMAGAAVLLAGLAAANLCWLAPLDRMFGDRSAVDLAGPLGPTSPIGVVHTLGPVSIWFALLGVLRRQRRVATVPWLSAAVVGAGLGYALDANAWWVAVLVAIVLGSAGLDDWLDNPLRRRGALLTLLLLALLGSPALTIAGPREPRILLPALGTLAMLATAMPTWRMLGVLRFKNVLAAIALLAFAAPIVLQPPPAFVPAVPAAPFGETLAAAPWPALRALAARPWWHFAGLAGTLAATALWVLLRRVRRQR